MLLLHSLKVVCTGDVLLSVCARDIIVVVRHLSVSPWGTRSWGELLHFREDVGVITVVQEWAFAVHVLVRGELLSILSWRCFFGKDWFIVVTWRRIVILWLFGRLLTAIRDYLVSKVILLMHADVLQLLNGLWNERSVDFLLLGRLLDARFWSLVRKLTVPCHIHVVRVDGAPVLLVDAFIPIWSCMNALSRCIEPHAIAFEISIFRDLRGFALKTCFEIHFTRT